MRPSPWSATSVLPHGPIDLVLPYRKSIDSGHWQVMACEDDVFGNLFMMTQDWTNLLPYVCNVCFHQPISNVHPEIIHRTNLKVMPNLITFKYGSSLGLPLATHSI